MREMTVAQLTQLLAQNAPVTVLDVRPAADFAEWSIPGSQHANVYTALKAGDTQALTHFSAPPDHLVVTVCGQGKVSLIAAEQLQKQGFQVASLHGGMKAWSLAWNQAELHLSPDLHLIQIRRTGKGCLSYLIASAGSAAVIDASVDPEIYLTLAQQQGWKITHTFDTHIHADHLSRSQQLANLCGAKFCLPPQERVAYPFQPLTYDQPFMIGQAQLQAIPTPGHTLESSSFLLNGQFLFTGDTLFTNGFGRPDLEANLAETEHRATLLYHSLQQLLALPPTTIILPGHTNTPAAFDQTIIQATLAEIKQTVPQLTADLPAFIAGLLPKIPPTPPNYQEIITFNQQGTWPADPLELEAGANRCAIN